MSESGLFANDSDAQWICAAALAALPMQTPRRLRRLIDLGQPRDVWTMLQSGHRPLAGIGDDVWRTWSGASSLLPQEMMSRCAQAGITVVTRHDVEFPSVLMMDPDAPAVLFVQGHLGVLANRRVGMIGTRGATRFGRHFARTLGRDLASESVCVVSGLARGIDVESHVGALEASGKQASSPAAVVASGLDIVYPPEHEKIWKEIGHRGVLITEAPPGTPPEAYRFPMRNRIIAALSEVLVVVESRYTGGSMITVREAMKRDVTVMAVPGAPGLGTNEGTNELLRDGCGPVTCAQDVLMALGLDHRRAVQWIDPRLRPEPKEYALLVLMGRRPVTLDELALLSGHAVVATAVTLGRLEAKGWVCQSDGWWEALLA